MKNLHNINEARIPPEFRAWAASIPTVQYIYDRAKKWMYSTSAYLKKDSGIHPDVLNNPDRYPYPTFHKYLIEYRADPNKMPPNIEII